MMNDFQYRDSDLRIFQEEFKNRLPDTVIDAHVHIWNKACIGISKSEYEFYRQYKPWTDFIYNEQFTIEDYMQCSDVLFPGKKLSCMIFGLPFRKIKVEKTNAYVLDVSARYGLPFFYIPTQHEDIFETESRLGLLARKGFVGFKPYPDLVQGTNGECGIYDMLNRSVLEFANKHGLTVMLHIPKKAKLRDEGNCRDLREIAQTYPNTRFIMAHVCRAFTYYDVDGLIDFLFDYDNMWFDTACVNDPMVMEYLFKKADSTKLVYGSDAPISYYRGRDVVLNNKHYIVTDKLVPWGFGPLNEAMADLTYIVYEELRAILYAMNSVYGTSQDLHIERFFYSNAKRILNEI